MQPVGSVSQADNGAPSIIIPADYNPPAQELVGDASRPVGHRPPGRAVTAAVGHGRCGKASPVGREGDGRDGSGPLGPRPGESLKMARLPAGLVRCPETREG
jgi:hypothetical protein